MIVRFCLGAITTLLWVDALAAFKSAKLMTKSASDERVRGPSERAIICRHPKSR